MVNKLRITHITPQVGRLRCVTSQVIACMSPYLLILDLGMAISFATISIPDLLNAKEGLSIDETQASWFGSIAFLMQPFGALLSGPLVDYFGRKKATFIVNIPHVIAWILMHFAWNVPMLFIANSLLGLGTGIMEAPINAYIGEISEPTIRGSLCTMTQVFGSLGVLAIYFLGVVVNWRNAALICLIFPISSMIFVFVIPETPVWLLSRNREKDAIKSLQYLRGWTSEENVKKEFDELVQYSKKLQECVICQANSDKSQECVHKEMNSLKRRLLKFRFVMIGKETIRPLILVIMYFLFYTMCSTIPIRSNMVNICGAFGMSDNGKNIALIVGIITLLTSILLVWIVKLVGKRKLTITFMLLSALSAVALSVYAKQYLDDTVFSYDTSTFPATTSYVPLILFYLLNIFSGVALPWVILSEVFPFRSRASGQGVAAAGDYIIMFIASKTLINLETSVHLWGTFAVYASFGFVGTIFLYFYLPETEGRSMQEIESYYSGEHRIFADDAFINCFRKTNR